MIKSIRIVKYYKNYLKSCKYMNNVEKSLVQVKRKREAWSTMAT